MTAANMQAASPRMGWSADGEVAGHPATGRREGTVLTPCSATLASCHKHLDMMHFPPLPPGTQGIPHLLLSWREVQHPRKAAAKSHPDGSGRQDRSGERCLNPKARGIFPAGSVWQRGTAQAALSSGAVPSLQLLGLPVVPIPTHSLLTPQTSPETRHKHLVPGFLMDNWSSTWGDPLYRQSSRHHL